MSLALMVDEFMYLNMLPFASHTSMWSTDKPFTITGVINLPKPTYDTLYNYLRSNNPVNVK